MRTYKSIKIYPGLPKGWKKGNLVTSIKNQDWYITSHFTSLGNSTIHANEIENHPEYWQEVLIEPIFISEDGIEVFEGDSYYRVSSSYNVKKCVCKKTFSGGASNCKSKYFVCKDAVLGYLVPNKPVLTIKELTKILNSDMCPELGPIEIVIKKIVELRNKL